MSPSQVRVSTDVPQCQRPTISRTTSGTAVDGRLVGTSGYMHGEELKVVRNDDGSVNHLDLATFILTRTPYDPAAPIPGGPPS